MEARPSSPLLESMGLLPVAKRRITGRREDAKVMNRILRVFASSCRSLISSVPRKTVALLGALAAVLLFAATAAAKPFDLGGGDWEGCSDFVRIARDDLGPERVIATSKLDMHDLKREDAIILLHPERTLDVESLAAFMRHGGRVVLLDDYGTGDTLLAHFSIQRVALPLHPAEMLRNNPELAVAEPASAHVIVKDITKVVTNHATGVRHPDLSPVLKVRGLNEPDVLLAEAGAVGQGRFLAIGDPSVVINSMLRYPGNKALARALLRYATDDDTWGKRGGRIFIAANDFEQTGTFGDDSALSETLHEWLRSAQDLLEGVRRDGLSATATYILAVVLGLAVVLWVGSRAGRTHRAAPPRFVRPIAIVAQGGVAGHAAVIGAPSTSRVLAMLEMKSALEEDLCGMLDLDQAPPHDVLVQKVREAGLLGADGLHTLKALLLRMAKVETTVLAARGVASKSEAGIRDREVIATAKAVKSILLLAHQRANGAGMERRHASDSAGPWSTPGGAAS